MNRSVRGFEICAIFVSLCGVALGQTDSLALSSSAVLPGGSTALNLTLSSPSGSEPAGIQWSITYNPSSIVAISAVEGPAALSASKSISCVSQSGSYTCLLTGLNANVIQNGIAAVVSVTLPSTASGTVSLGVSNTVGTSPAGAAVSLVGTGGVISVSTVVNPPVGILSETCTPTALTLGATATCSVTLNASAPSGGSLVSISTDNAVLRVPGSVTVAAGSSSASFTVTAGNYTAPQTAVVTASLGSSSQTATLSLVTSAVLSSLSCTPTSLSTAATATCTVTLPQAAPAGGTAVSLSSSSPGLRVPGSVTVPVGATSANFTATAGTITLDQAVVVTATLGGNSQTTTVSLVAQPLVSSLGCTPSSLGVGAAATCMMTLSKAAPGGGVVVSLSSNNAALSVPASVTVTAAASSASFPATAGSVTADQTALVTATLGGSSQSASLSLVASTQVTSLVCAPSSLGTGSSVTCTMTLSKAAPAGGVAVSLSSNNPALSVPASVTVPAGLLSVSFPANAGSVTTDQAAVVTASLGSSSQTANLSLVSSVIVSALGCAPASLGTGATTACTVTLSKAAPAGGVVVSLSISNPALNIPASVTVPAGASTANFTTIAGSITTDQTAVVTASLGGSSQTANLSLVTSLLVSALSCAPSSIGNGVTAACTVTLSKAAPAGGAMVAVSSNSGALSVPAAVTVAAGASTANFTATPTTITLDQTAAVTATLGNGSQTVTLTLVTSVLVSALSCTPSSLATGAAATCTVTLATAAPAGGTSVSLSSSIPALSVPAAVTVAAGSTLASFTALAGNITSNQVAIVVATFNSSLQVTPVSLIAPAGQPQSNSNSVVIGGIPGGVLDAAGYTANLAQGSIFVVKGSNLGPAGSVQASNYPLQTSLNGVSITLTPANGGDNVSAYMLYTYNLGGITQLAAILPSTAAPGNYNLTVTNNYLTGDAVPVTVVARKFGIFSADTTGSGAAALQVVDGSGTNYLNRFTKGTLPTTPSYAYSPAHPGDYVIAYGTGLGPIQVADNGAPGPIDLRDGANVQILVGGKAIAPVYAGRSPSYAGLDQINLQLPPDVQTGCAVSFQVSVGGQISNRTSIAIAPPNSDVCSPSPFSPDILSRLDQGGSLVVGNFFLSQLVSAITEPLAPSMSGLNESAIGAFTKYPASQLANIPAFMNSPGSCQVSRVVGTRSQLAFGAIGTNLDAGNVVLNGPNVSNQQFSEDATSKAYSLPLGTVPALPAGLYLPLGFPSFTDAPTIMDGTYQLFNSGGADVGRFSTSVAVGKPLSITRGIPSTVDRSQDLTFIWAGGNPGDLVAIAGVSGSVVGGTASDPIYDAGTFTCTTTASAGSMAVPAAVLAQMPITPTSPGSGISYLQVSSWTPLASGNGTFTAPLTAGGNLDGGAFIGRLGVFATANYR